MDDTVRVKNIKSGVVFTMPKSVFREFYTKGRKAELALTDEPVKYNFHKSGKNEVPVKSPERSLTKKEAELKKLESELAKKAEDLERREKELQGRE